MLCSIPAVLLPLLGTFINRMTTMIFSFISWGVVVALILYQNSLGSTEINFVQIPILSFVTVMAFFLSHQNIKSVDELLQSDIDELNHLKEKHRLLKDSISSTEQEENRSLQVYAVAKGLAESLSWKDMAPRLTTGIQKIFGAYEFLIYAFDNDGHWTTLLKRGSWAQDPPIQDSIPSQTCFLKPPQVQEVVPVLTVPVYSEVSGEQVMNGLLFVKSPAVVVNEPEMIKTGQELGEQLSMTLNKALMFSQMEMRSKVDGLTGVLRRQAFMDRLAEELKKAVAFKAPFSLMMVDIDHFKSVNDAHGHGAGDAVLAKVGELLKTSIYETDVVGRYGGEEFILLMPKAQPDGVLRKAEAIRQRIQNEVIQSGFERLHVTVSIGVSHFPRHGSTESQMIARADKALYQAKETGRNRVIEA